MAGMHHLEGKMELEAGIMVFVVWGFWGNVGEQGGMARRSVERITQAEVCRICTNYEA